MTDEEGVVYVVDDDSAVRKGLARLLRSAGLAVETFASAAAFLARDRYQGVACILLDVRMPGVGGMELQADLAAQNNDLPIVFLSGHGDIPMSVKIHRGRVMKKLGLTTVAELIQACQRAGIGPPVSPSA